MINRVYSIVVIFFSAAQLIGQCPTADILLNTQAEIDAFSSTYPGCTTIPFGITIDDSIGGTINNLDGLAQITNIDGFLNIQNNQVLPDLDGLDNLTGIGGFLAINTNASLSSLAALANLTSVSGYVSIGNNDGLGDLQGLESLTGTGQYLSVVSNDILSSLTGLEGITSIGGGLSIEFNPALVSLQGLQNLSSVGLHISIRWNTTLPDLDGLQNLTSVGNNITVSLNENLVSLNGLDNVDPTSINYMWLQSNGALSDCAVTSVCNYLIDPSNGATISNNLVGCDDRPEVEASCSLLPIDLIAFDGQKVREMNRLRWRTAHEVDNQGFEIQRSADGQLWQAIGFLPGKGIEHEMTDYEFTDYTPLAEDNFYRLKQIDQDGSHMFSNIVVLNGNQDREFALSPNPATDYLHLQGHSNLSGVIVDSYGAVLLEVKKATSAIPLNHLRPGIYAIIMTDGEEVLCEKFTKL